MTAPEHRNHESQGDAGHAFLHDALTFLTGDGRRKSPEGLLAGLKQRFRLAGHEKLADLVYEMARSCLTALPDFAQRAYQPAQPRRPEVIVGELDSMNARLAGVAPAADLAGVARSLPAAEQALADAAKCLAVLERLEGPSDRQQILLALSLIHRGQPQAAEPLLRAIMDEPGHAPEMRWYATSNLAFALHRQDRSAEAIEVARRALEARPEDPAAYFNILSSAAELRDRPVFDDTLRRLSALYRAEGTEIIRSWIEHSAEELGSQLGLGAEQILAAVSRDQDPPGGRTR